MNDIERNDSERDGSERQLERAIDRIAREQPLRRAPRTLAIAVLARIEDRAAQPWWRKDFLHWPLGARVGFLLSTCVPVAIACVIAIWLDTQLDTASGRLSQAPELTAMHAITAAVQVVNRYFPAEWLYGGAAVVAALYAVIFGLGAVGYRALYARRSDRE